MDEFGAARWAQAALRDRFGLEELADFVVAGGRRAGLVVAKELPLGQVVELELQFELGEVGQGGALKKETVFSELSAGLLQTDSVPDCFTFTIEELARMVPESIKPDELRSTLDLLAFKFGDLASENPEHLVMQSKIRKRPLIKLEAGHYFAPVQGLLNSFLMEVVESWTKSDSKLKERYHKRRAVYLEMSLKEMLEGAFRNCLIKTGTYWLDAEDSKEYENDCLVVCGPLALVFEAKSESVDDVAKRGGSKTLADRGDVPAV